MAKHPTLIIPNIGPMDHAWDLLGEWRIALEEVFLRFVADAPDRA